MLILPLRFVAFSQNGLQKTPPNFSPSSISSFHPATNESYPFFACSKRNAHHQNLFERERRNHANKMGNGTRNIIREKNTIRNTIRSTIHEKNTIQNDIHGKDLIQSTIHEKNTIRSTIHEKNTIRSTIHEKNTIRNAIREKTPFEAPSVKKTPFETPFVVKFMWDKRWRKIPTRYVGGSFYSPTSSLWTGWFRRWSRRDFTGISCWQIWWTAVKSGNSPSRCFCFKNRLTSSAVPGPCSSWPFSISASRSLIDCDNNQKQIQYQISYKEVVGGGGWGGGIR